MGFPWKKMSHVGVRMIMIKIKEDNGIINKMLNIILDKLLEIVRIFHNPYLSIGQMPYNLKVCMKIQ
jgi:hypothetical protein